jgi:hypothetical protein
LLAFLHEVTRMANEDHLVVEAEVVIRATDPTQIPITGHFDIESVSFDPEANSMYVFITPRSGAAE